jgi:single-strand DNA-binding protein
MTPRPVNETKEFTMSGETAITVTGNLTADPELRFTDNGTAVANFTVASTPRTFDRQSGTWTDGDALFLRCTLWRQAAENAAESLSRGTRVLVEGRLRQRSFETKDGERRTVVELDVDEIGPSLKFATATVNKAVRRSANNPAADNAWTAPPTESSPQPEPAPF